MEGLPMDHVVDDRGDLCYLPATEALRLFRERRLSPVELMAAVIARAEAVEPAVNALCVTYFDEALDAARKAEDAYMGRGDDAAAPQPASRWRSRTRCRSPASPARAGRCSPRT